MALPLARPVLLAACSALLAAAGLAWLRRLAAVGAAFKAKILASALFVGGRELDPERAPEVSAEAYRLLRCLRARVDRAQRKVTVSFWGLVPRTAEVRPGMGAALALRPLPPAPEPPRPRARDETRPWPEGAAPLSCANPALEKALDRAFAETDAKFPRRTRAVLVVHQGRLAAERYAPGFTAQTPLPGWSMTKTVMGVLIGGLAAEGRLGLDRRGLLKEWRGPADPRSSISLEDLLRMRSGLKFSESYADPGSEVNRMLFTEPDGAGYAASRPLAAPPGRRWQYCSGSTNLLSLIARRELGDKVYWRWPRQALFEPLGMDSAVFETDASGTFVASSFLHAAARDWARLGLLLAQGGVWQGRSLLSGRWLDFMKTPTPQSPGGCFGAHLWLKLSRSLGGAGEHASLLGPDAFHALGHEGQCLTVLPSRGLVVLRLGLSIRRGAWNHAAFVSDVIDAVR